MNETIALYESFRKRIKAFHYALWMISWDSLTEAPNGCYENRAIQTGVLAEEYYKIQTSQECVDTIQKLYEQREELEPVLRHEITEMKRDLDKTLKVPMDEFVRYQTLRATSETIWAKAKNANDFSIFAPVLEEIVAYMRRYVGYQKTDELQGYNILLDEYERDFTTKEYDVFFDLLRKELVPLVKQITGQQQPEQPFASLPYDTQTQKEFANYLIDVLDFDKEHGLMKESEHPCTSNFSSSDVRFTNHYYETVVLSGIFSAIHELGHAIYEQQCDPELEVTASGGGASMAMHESQSRFFENMIGRSKEFWAVHLPKLRAFFPEQLKDISLDDFYTQINHVANSFIRTEADELTYPLHIMLRYDIEKKLISGELEVKDLPETWNRLMKEYFGLEVPSNKMGVLQDVHWSGGMFGYFPTYALGSAYAAQIFAAMNQDFNVMDSLKDGTTAQINAWLKEKIHHYGSSKYPKEILKLATGQDFDPQYYITYLKNKYQAIYL